MTFIPTEEEYGPAIWLNRVVILTHPEGGKGSVMVCFQQAKPPGVDIKVGWYDFISQAIPDITEWCSKTRNEIEGVA